MDEMSTSEMKKIFKAMPKNIIRKAVEQYNSSIENETPSASSKMFGGVPQISLDAFDNVQSASLSFDNLTKEEKAKLTAVLENALIMLNNK